MVLCNTNCTLWRSSLMNDSITAPKYEADPDIAGVGIITAFVMSAALTLCLSAVHIALITPSGSDNGIDYWIVKIAENLFHVTQDHRAFWVPVIESVVLNLSDQQLLTGIAILVAGFWTHCSISVRHFSMVNDLAFFSSTVHLATMDVLQYRLRNRPILRAWRVGLMVCLASLLATSCMLRSHWAWEQSWNYAAQCLFDDLIGNVHGILAIRLALNLFGIVALYLAYITRLYEYFPQAVIISPDTRFYKIYLYLNRQIQHLKVHLSHIDHRTSAKNIVERTFDSVCIAVLHVVRFPFLTPIVLLGSHSTWNRIVIVWFISSLRALLKDRAIPGPLEDGSENTMSFGQIIPIFLLASTIFVFREAYDDQMNEMKKLKKPHDITSAPGVMTTNPSTTSLEMSDIPNPDQEHADEPALATPRRVDTEMGGGSMASGRQSSSPQPQVQSRHTFPLVRQN